ncbi:hypothetical protein [Dickeya dianthicola]|uniref:hypothetical protein n=1 Tax=Dickeya dianthicola TaxID=204039 RepID=UPI0030179E6E
MENKKSTKIRGYIVIILQLLAIQCFSLAETTDDGILHGVLLTLGFLGCFGSLVWGIR